MSIKITCKFCGASMDSSTVQEAIAWNASHDEFCTGDALKGGDDEAR